MKQTKAQIIEELKAVKKELAKAMDPTLQHLRLENGALDMALAGPVVQNMNCLLAEWFREGGAENYVEMTFHEKKPPFDTFVVTTQRVAGKTPHQLRAAAEHQRNSLAEALRDAKRFMVRVGSVGHYDHDILDKVDAALANSQ